MNVSTLSSIALVVFTSGVLCASAAAPPDLARPGDDTPVAALAGCGGQPNGGACDDFNDCTSNDACSDGVCAGIASAPMPPEIAHLEFSKSGADTLISWEVPDSAMGVDVVRGKIAGGAVSPLGIGQSCLGRNLDPFTTSMLDVINPPLGTGYWYLVRAVNSCGIGAWGGQRAGATTTARVTECGCTPDPAAYGASRFSDTYLTVMDRRTCLEWEKKGDIGTTHDPQMVMDWGEANQWVPVPPNWIQAVNGERFAGHGDWRLPTSWGPPEHRENTSPEIESLLLTPCPGYPTPCIDPAFGFTPNHGTRLIYPPVPLEASYWSGTTARGAPYSPSYAWAVDFLTGTWTAAQKQHNDAYVRAVRGGF